MTDSGDDGFFATARVAIIGLGLMGGSLALALRGKCAALFGIDPDLQACMLAQQLGIVDQVAASGHDLLPQADFVILAAPVGAIISLLEQLPQMHPGAPVVMDIGSTKVQIMAAMQALPERFDPIGGHPMCGKEKASLAYAEAGMCQGAPFALTTLPRTSQRARQFALEVVRALGAQPLWLDAHTHDYWVGFTSHLPYLAANALATVPPDESAPMIGSGFRSTTRLAGSSIQMMEDILQTNRENVLFGVRMLQQRLAEMGDYLADGNFDQLRLLLQHGAERRAALVERRQGGDN